ncbi:Prolamin-like domain-containing protein [Hirschfeldia incana]|nr:Prolamin-like domain-containing protein [Hirschfeldia incana]
MENKALVMGFLLITTLISSTYPSLTSQIYEKPIIDPDTSLEDAFARSPGSEEYNNNAFNSIPAPDANYFAKNCMKPRDDKCDDELVLDLLKSEPMSKECCLKILRYGEGCNVLIVKFISRAYQLKRFSKRLLLRTERILNRCSAETSTPLSG